VPDVELYLGENTDSELNFGIESNGQKTSCQKK
jgi:hypothetical protein